MTPKERAKRAYDQIVDDLTDRKGLRHVWDNLDSDVLEEIRTKWEEIIFESIVEP